MSNETKIETSLQAEQAKYLKETRSWHELLSQLKPWAVFIFIKDNMQNDFSWPFIRLINGALGNGKSTTENNIQAKRTVY